MSNRADEDVEDLARFGYRQDLDRSLGSFSSFAASFSYISILTGVFQMFYLGYGTAGPVYFWTWPIVLCGQLTVALGFAELAAHYPLSGGIYQWSRRVGTPVLGWLTGWIYLSCSVISLAAVALALQSTLPQLDAGFQLLGDGANPHDRARNAVVLGCGLILLTTVINALGVRLMARINNVGVFTELLGVILLIVLLLANRRQGPEILFQAKTPSEPGLLGWLGPLLAAAVMPGYVLYGFDTAGTLAEETRNPRQRAPRAIVRALLAAGLTGGMLIAAGIMAARDWSAESLGQISGGLPQIVNDALGRRLGGLFLADVIFSVMVCALAVHAGTVRLMFAMARDNNLPFARTLALVPEDTRAPLAPALLTGLFATLILVANVNFSKIIETLCSVAIIWANLAYLLVSAPLLIMRWRGWPGNDPELVRGLGQEGFSLGRCGPWVNLAAVGWGIFVVVNLSWPRTEIYGNDAVGRYAAIIATATLLGLGLLYYAVVQRRRSGILAEHAAGATTDPAEPSNLEETPEWTAGLAGGD